MVETPVSRGRTILAEYGIPVDVLKWTGADNEAQNSVRNSWRCSRKNGYENDCCQRSSMEYTSSEKNFEIYMG